MKGVTMGIYKEVFEDETPVDSYQAQIAELKLEVHRLSQDRLKAIAIIKEYKSRIVDLKEHVKIAERVYNMNPPLCHHCQRMLEGGNNANNE